jgi:hypothetical protein
MTLNEAISSNEYESYKRAIDQLDAPLEILVNIDNLLGHLRGGNLSKETFVFSRKL